MSMEIELLKTKECNTCQKSKGMNLYYWKNKSKGIKNNKCKLCLSGYNRNHYKENIIKYKEKAKKHNKKYILRGRIFLYELKLGNPCCLCGEDNPNVLEFDHINPEDKRQEIAYMATHAYSIETIKKEIDKCIILCANCHRERTAIQQGWYKYNV